MAKSAPGSAAVGDELQPDSLQPGEDPENRLVSPFLKHLATDQGRFWTSPARFQSKDLHWILPAAGFTAAFLASDSWWSKQVPVSHMATSKKISDEVHFRPLDWAAGRFS